MRTVFTPPPFHDRAEYPAQLIQQDKDGVPWRDKLIASARKEFEDARHERDPEIIARLLIGICLLSTSAFTPH